eukprot:CAMPEP_0194496232 /NCGR_PEP_ID=MMETSP0253-20130528/13576_1 /TAXON_ID=2966 /ORGANISM="Noctiluca scintillans" /LENGTH=52 /DNA_ID=CAMNT_0039337605 /DNA_START=440 /DNA_END=598 /DNA_ORIENTATION=+
MADLAFPILAEQPCTLAHCSETNLSLVLTQHLGNTRPSHDEILKTVYDPILM